ncbi:MAG: hypothetical protein KDC48_24265, partial [Planctomycetes bacterium]|nr:hypothetical protein [Planctomycetota bacterium]
MTPRNLLVAVVAVAIVAAAALLLLYAPGGDAMVDAARSTPTPAASDGATQPAEALTPIAADPAVTTS